MIPLTNDDPWSKIEVSVQSLVGRRVSQSHALHIYWVRAIDGAPGLLVRGGDPARVPYEIPQPRGLVIEKGEWDAEFELRLFLRGPEERDVFRTLCEDLVSYSSAEKSRGSATAALFRRLGHWHSLMSRGRSSVMASHEVRGLIGELLFLETLIETRGFETALCCWVAPDDHPQDFATDDRILEVKTRLSGSRQQVQISSLEQLESPHLPLSLVVVELAMSDAPEAMSLNGICSRLAKRAAALGPSQVDDLESALANRGYMRQDAYDLDSYRLVGITAFEVRGGFPRLRRADVDLRIPEVRYMLELTSLKEFEVSVETTLN